MQGSGAASFTVILLTLRQQHLLEPLQLGRGRCSLALLAHCQTRLQGAPLDAPVRPLLLRAAEQFEAVLQPHLARVVPAVYIVQSLAPQPQDVERRWRGRLGSLVLLDELRALELPSKLALGRDARVGVRHLDR